MRTLSPRPSRIAPRLADARPFPRDETTPPVTNTNRVIRHPAASGPACDPMETAGDCRPGFAHDGMSAYRRWPRGPMAIAMPDSPARETLRDRRLFLSF